jgi:uncharacterized protein YjbI with pentapeptide repeats
MANQQQVDLSQQEVTTSWNTWREEHPDTPISLNGEDLSETNLGDVNRAGADLSHANLSRADLKIAHLSQAKVGPSSLEPSRRAKPVCF